MSEKEVYFLTNLQRTTWVARQAAALSGTVQKIQAHAKTAAIIDVGQEGAENLAVEGLALADPIAVDRPADASSSRPAQLRRDAHRRGRAASSSARSNAGGPGLDLRQNGERTIKELKSGEQVRVSFEYTFPDAGDYVVQVEVDHDGLESRRRPPRRGDGQGHGAGAAGQRQAGRPGLRSGDRIRPHRPESVPRRQSAARRPRRRPAQGHHRNRSSPTRGWAT